jgi:uncharacterized protein
MLPLRCIALLWLFGIAAQPINAAQVITPTINGEITVKSWKALRDAHVVKQDMDFSCGAASLATILNEFYGSPLTEQQILKDMNKQDMVANFEDMAKVVKLYNFKSGGLALSYDQLAKLTVPVIVYLQYRGSDHFSVLRGISDTHVQLADPSWGNRIFSRPQFLAMWETRDDENLKGKILLLMPQSPEIAAQHQDFFAPPNPSRLSLEAQTLFRLMR